MANEQLPWLGESIMGWDMTFKEYAMFKERVLATVGKERPELIHRINNQLGIIINAIGSLQSRRNCGKVDRDADTRDRMRVKNTLEQIAATTGVHP